jgi:formate hydrogenlyase subunit 4
MQKIIITLFAPLLILAAGIVIGLFFKGIDRKIAAYFQSRIGPKLRQPFYDLRKLMYKETVVPEYAVDWVFRGAPGLTLASTALLLSYIWMPYMDYLMGTSIFLMSGDLIVILYILMIPAIALIAGGFASGSPYAAVGSQREMVILISTELPLAVIFVAFGWQMNAVAPGLPAFSISTIAAVPIWSGLGPFGIIGVILLAVTMVAIIPAELAKVPFDQAEAETEIAEGLIAEYSGRYLAFFHLSDALKGLAVCSVAVILFFPHGITELFGLKAAAFGYDFTPLADAGFFLLKLLLLISFSVTFIRIAAARFKITQVVKIFTITLTAASLAGFALIALDPVLSRL